MPVYADHIWAILILASLPAISGIVVFVYFDRERTGLFLIVLSALLVRLVLIASDPFLHDWDERFHALVARHMMDHPFTPMLHRYPIMPYDPADWHSSHIWLHKQPLFLWQMALSMKLFGVTEFALRLPSALMGTLQVLFVYQIAKFWTKDRTVAILAGLISAFAYFQIELSAGRYATDHNDVAFAFYVTAGFWGFTRYLRSGYHLKWALLTGGLVGCAILVKWLTALLVFGGWGLYILLHSDLRTHVLQYRHLILAVLTAAVVSAPWQLYITSVFPVESAVSYTYNWRHITEALGPHSGPWTFHLSMISRLYGPLSALFIILGVVSILRSPRIPWKFSSVMLSVVLVIYGFFSFVVTTKLSGFTYPVHAVMVTFMASGVLVVVRSVHITTSFVRNLVIVVVMSVSAVYALNPLKILRQRQHHNEIRSREIYNAGVLRSLPKAITGARVILNCRLHEEVEVMFYKGGSAYSHWPEERVLDSLQNAGYQFAAFRSHGDQQLPEYITSDTAILILWEQLR